MEVNNAAERPQRGFLDLLRTELQETGRVGLTTVSLAELMAVVEEIGISPRTVKFTADSAVVVL